MTRYDPNHARLSDASAARRIMNRASRLLMAGVSPVVFGVGLTAIPTQQASGQAVNLNPSVNNIRIDGRTKTKIRVKGNRTSIRTKTISRGTAFNSFRDFQQAAGQRVDLYVPDRAGALVNIVRNGSVVVNGTLNAYKNGKIGGNVFFSSSKGFVVGKTGRINVGSLTVNTPTKKFLDKLLPANGKVNNAMAARLLRGEIPISRDGVISIAGKINAKNGITLQGQSVTIHGSKVMLGGQKISQRTKFDSTVNTAGMAEGAALVSRGGKISIVAAGNVRVGGRLNVSGTAKRKAGSISIRSGRNTTITSSAVLQADAGSLGGKGGEVIIKADGNLIAADASSYSARGLGLGDGGFVELSGKNATIGSVQVNLGSDKGKAGTFLIDPLNLYIGGTAPAGESVSPNILSNGANIILQADNSITVQDGGILDSRSIGADGNITLQAPSITLGDGSKVLAGTRGDVLLEAVASPTFFSGATQIALGSAAGTAAELTGRNITLTATTNVDQKSLLLALPTAKANITANNAAITAADTFTATATANVVGGLVSLPIGVVTSKAEATVDIGGTTQLNATHVTLSANASVISTNKTESLAPASAKADGAVAVSIVDSTARVRVGDNANIVATGDVTMTATNTVDSSVDATPQGAAFGASVGFSKVAATTTSEIGDAAQLSAANLTLSGTTSTKVTVNAAAATGGAEEPEAGSKSKELLEDPEYAKQAKTSSGSVSVVGALGISDLDSVTSTNIASSGALTVTGATALQSTTGNTSTIVADGSAVADSATGVGAAFGLNLANVKNDATAAQDITTGSLALTAALAPAGNVFSNTVTSGAGASNVGVAGSFAVNAVDTQASANIADGKTITITGVGDVVLSATNASTITASATPTGVGAAGSKVGVGASLALNIAANRATAGVGNGALVRNARSLSLQSRGTFTADATAEAGAAGGVGVTPVLALSLINNKTSATLGTAATTEVNSGDVFVTAMQSSQTKTGASAKAAGSKAAVGIGLGIAVVDDQAIATSNRSLDADGRVDIVAAGDSGSEVTAIASAVGGEADESAASGGAGNSSDVDSKVTGELQAGSQKQKDAGVGDAEQQAKTDAEIADGDKRSASTSQGKVAVAAGVGVNAQTSTVVASVADGAGIDAGNNLTIAADSNVKGTIVVDGSAVGEPDKDGEVAPVAQIGIGAAVAVNSVQAKTDALLGNGVHTVGGLRVNAGKRDVAALMAGTPNPPSKSDEFSASATSGAGGGKVGIAGSLALNLIDTQSTARIANGATVNLNNNADISLNAYNAGDTSATAKPAGGGATGKNVGIGASAAINILANRSQAKIGDGVTVAKTGATSGDVSLNAGGKYTANAEAQAGGEGGIGITPVLGLSIVNNSSNASIGTGATPLMVDGSVAASALLSSTTVTKADAAAAGSKAAVGAAVAIALIDDEAIATTARDVTTGGAASFNAASLSDSTVSAKASAVGAEADDGSGGASGDVDSKVSGELQTGAQKQKDAGVGDTEQKAKTDADANDDKKRSASTSEGKVSVAAAVAVNVQDASAEAGIPDGVSINSGGALTLSADGVAKSDVSANGSAVATPDASGATPPAAKVGIGAAVAVNSVRASRTATLGNATHIVNGLNIRAGKRDATALLANPASTAEQGDTFGAKSTSGAGGSSVGLAGSLSLNLIDTESKAAISENAIIEIQTGNVALIAENESTITADAKPVGGGATGEKLGIGASVAINIIANRAEAVVENGAKIHRPLGPLDDVSLSAQGKYAVISKAQSGGSGGIALTPVLALSLVNNTASARLGTGDEINSSGAVSLSARQTAATTTEAQADAAGSKAAIGAAVAIALIDDRAIATTNRNITTTGAGSSVTFSAAGDSSSDVTAKASAVGAAGDDNSGGASGTVDSKVTDQLQAGSTKQKDAGVGDTEQQAATTGEAADENKRSASSSQGKISVAAAVGVNVQKASAEAAVPDGVVINTGGALTLEADSNVVGNVTSNGSAVGKADASGATPPTSAVGIGAAVSVNLVKSNASAVLGSAVHTASSLKLHAGKRDAAGLMANSASTTRKGDVYSASATSGAGGEKVGFAGSLALNLIDTQAQARLTAGSTLNLTGGAVTFEADNEAKTTAEAKPDGGGATGGKVGIGASVAINILANRSIAELEDGASLQGTMGDVSFDAAGKFETITKAEAGGAGGIGITPVLGLSIVNNTTSARIGTGNTLTPTSSLSLTARQVAATTTEAKAEAAGSKAAIGVSAAIALVDDQAIATTDRDINAGGAVAFNAAGASSSTVLAQASAVGAAGEEPAGGAPGGNDVDSKVSGEIQSGDSKQKAAGVGSDKQKMATTAGANDDSKRSASTSEGKVSVAAAVGVNVQTSTVQAAVPDGISITSGGALSLAADSNVVGTVTTDGAAVGLEDASGATPPVSQVGIGAAVSVNSVQAKTDALLGNGTHRVGGLNLNAGKRDVAALMANPASTTRLGDTMSATATSGAGGSKVGIAGSLALNLIDTQASAKIAPNSNVTITGGGAVTLTADNESAIMANAKPVSGGAAGGKVGIGASVALNINANRAEAELGDGAVLTGDGGTPIGNVTLGASGKFDNVTKAESGSSGGVAITPVLALAMVNNTTSARLGTGAGFTSSGAVSLSSKQTTSYETEATAAAAGSTAAIGAAVAIALMDDKALVEVARDVSAGGNVSLAAANTSSSEIEAVASAAGAAAPADETAGAAAPTGGVDNQVDSELATGKNKQTAAGVGSADQKMSTNTKLGQKDKRSAKTSEGKVSVAAAVGVAVQDSTATALNTNGATITSGGRLTLSADATTGSSVTTDGSAVKGDDGTQSQVGIGVAVSVNDVDETSKAVLSGTGHSANGVTLSAEQKDASGAVSKDVFEASATSGAGGSKVGIAGSLALNNIGIETTAKLDAGASVDAGTAGSEIRATQISDNKAIAKPTDAAAVGGKVGIGASVALNILDSTVTAEVADGATISNGRGLTVAANTETNTETEAKAGAAGGIAVDVSLALALLDQKTSARIGTGSGLLMGTGAVSVTATNSGMNKAMSTGENKSGKVGVGASAALILGTGDSDAGQVLSNTSGTEAGVFRNVNAGSLEIEATSSRSYDAVATATSGGGQFNDADSKSNKDTGGGVESTKTIDKTKSSQDKIEGGTKAQSSDGKTGSSAKVSVAAAAGIAAIQDDVTATLGAVTVTTNGDVRIATSNITGVATVGDGQAVAPPPSSGQQGAKVGVGIGVGLGILNNKSSASIADGATIANSSSITVSATSKENAEGDYVAKLTAKANAGASASKVAVAGALAVGISTGDTSAEIGNNVGLTSTGAVSVTADNASQLSAKASAEATSTGNTAVGAAIAISVSERTNKATIGAGNTINSVGVTVDAKNRKIIQPPALPAPADYRNLSKDQIIPQLRDDLQNNRLAGVGNYYVEAIGGAAANSTAVQGSFGIMVFDDEVTARIGKNGAAATTINAGAGAVNVNAENDYSAKALSGAIALSGKTGVGVSASVIVSSGETKAELARNTTINNAGDLTVSADAKQDIEIYGITAAAASTTGIAGVATVLTSENKTNALVGYGSNLSANGEVNVTANNEFDTFNLAGAAAGGGTTGIGAAGTVIIVNNETGAKLEDGTSVATGVTLNAAGNVNVLASAKETGQTFTAAGAAGGSTAVGAGLILYKLDTKTEAQIGKFARIGQTTRLADLTIRATDTSELDTIAGGVGLGGSTGVGGAGSVAIIAKATSATLGADALVNAGSVLVEAKTAEDLDTLVVAAGVGGSTGVAGSVEVSAVTNSTKASIGERTVVDADNNVGVIADGETKMRVLTGGAAGGGSAAIGAAATVTVIDNTIEAKIAGNANITARGLSATGLTYTEDYTPSFATYGANEKIKGPNIDTDEAKAIAGGSGSRLLTSVDARTAGRDLLLKDRNSARDTRTARGVVVNASGATAVKNLTIAGAAGGSAGIGFAASVPVITTNTKALVEGAVTINSGKDVAVAAASDVYSMGIAGAAGAGGSVGVGGGIGVSVLDATTEAKVEAGANIAAGRDGFVTALAHEDVVMGGAAGSAAGTVAVSGGVSVLAAKSKTHAILNGDLIAQENLDIIARDVTRTAQVAGAVAIGGKAGIGASVSVVKLNKDTKAAIGAGANVAAYARNNDDHSVLTGDTFTSTRTSGGGLNLLADSAQSAFSLTLAGAGGFFAGVSGAITIELTDVATEASVGAGATINAANALGDADQDVVIAARDTTVTDAFTGGLAVGIAGIAGAVEVGVFKNRATAKVDSGATVNAKNDVLISALSNKDSKSLTVSASGGIVGVAAGVSVLSYGDGEAQGGEADTKLKESSENGNTSLMAITGEVDDRLKDDEVNKELKKSDDEDIQTTSQRAQDARAAESVSGVIGTSIPKGTSASANGATFNAGGKVALTSSDDLKVVQETGAVAVGAVGVAAGVGVVTASNGSEASVKGSSITAGSVAVTAKTDHNIRSLAIAASGGLSAAINADAAIIVDKSSTTAFIDGGSVTALGGAVNILADAKRKADASGYGGAVGGVAGIGASIATAIVSGDVYAGLGQPTAAVGAVNLNAGSLSIMAKSDDDAEADTLAAGGGIGAAIQGSVSVAKTTATTTAAAKRANITTTGATNIQSQTNTDVETDSIGVAVAGGLAVGASLSNATAASASKADVDNANITAGSVLIKASSTTASVDANAVAAAGALIGISATSARANNTSSAEAVATNSQFNVTNGIVVDADTVTNQNAVATGVSVGYVALGANDAASTSNTKTRAILNHKGGLNAGSVTIDADGTDTNNAEAVAGAGGVVAGTAASLITNATSNTVAQLTRGSAIAAQKIDVTGLVNVTADHTTRFGGTVNSLSAGIAGASGALLNHTVNSTVDASIGNGVKLQAHDLTLTATNNSINAAVINNGWNVNAIAGGLVGVPASGDTVRVTHNTTATIGDNVDVLLDGTVGNLSLLSQKAQNSIDLNQRVRLDSGGAIALARGSIDVVVNSNATTGIGSNGDVVVAAGDVNMAAWGDADIDIAVNATTYGLAGALSGAADITYIGNNIANVGAGSKLEVSKGITPINGDEPTNGEIYISAGKKNDVLQSDASLKFKATLDLFNKTAIPIPATPNPTVTANVQSSINIGAGPIDRGVRAAGDISLVASKGNIDATARGTGKDIYREALAKVASAVSNAFGGGDVTFDYHGGSTNISASRAKVVVDGTVQTGLERTKSLTLDYVSNTCDPANITCMTSSGDIGFSTQTNIPIGTQIFDRLDELEQLKVTYSDDVIAVAAYNNEIKFLQDKLVAMGLANYNATTNAFERNGGLGTSPKQQLISIATDANVAASAALGQISGNLTGIVSEVAGQPAPTVRINLILTDTGFGVDAEVTAAVATIKGFSKYSAGTDLPTLNAAESAAAAAKTASDDARALKLTNVGLQTNLDNARAALASRQTDLANAVAASDNAAENSARMAIDALKVTITTALNDIRANNTTISGYAETARLQTSNARSDLINLANTLNGRSGRNPGQIANDTARRSGLSAAGGPTQVVDGITYRQGSTLNGELTNLNIAIRSLSETKTDLIAAETLVVNRTNPLLNAGVASVGALADVIKDQTAIAAAATRDAATASNVVQQPTTNKIVVDGTVARLSNISVEGDELSGANSGLLSAPGDARIDIVNNTSNILEVGNLSIPTTDKGKVRFNGILVNDKNDINDINTGGATYGGSVATSLVTGRGTIDIKSNYNPENAAFYSSTAPASQQVLAKRRVAPDLITRTGTTINNLSGAVRLTSQAGNIYVNGAINAGSVDILAKNGDFVSSFVNGFNHIGGDPASFNSAVSAAEAGKGVTANGAVSISARFLNINSTIQSGIADWKLNIGANPLLTARPNQIGVSNFDIQTKLNTYRDALNAGSTPSATTTVSNGTQSFVLNMAPGINAADLQAAVNDYKSKIVGNPNSNPLRVLSVDGVNTLVNIKDYLSGSPDYRLEITQAQADAHALANGGNGEFEVITDAASNIGVVYDTDGVNPAKFVVDGTSVKGGYIQLFGQVMNTGDQATGKLNVLDGFGKINIDNQTNLDVVLGTLNTGDDASGLGRGTEGRIEITDVGDITVSPAGIRNVGVTKTIFTRDTIGGSLKVNAESQTGFINDAGEITLNGAISNRVGTARDSHYDPRADQRYVWTNATQTSQTTTFNVKQTQLFGASALTISETTTLNNVSAPNILSGPNRLLDGTYVTTDTTQVGGTVNVSTNQGILLIPNPASKANSDPTIKQFESSDVSYINGGDPKPVETSRHRDCNWWTLCIASDVTIYYKYKQNYRTITTNSLKADNRIGVTFIGEDVGSIDVTSKGNLHLTNTINNVSGTTNITASTPGKSIVQANLAAEIASKDINLKAGGSIGGLTAAGAAGGSASDVRVRLTTPGGAKGAISAVALDGNVALTTRGELRIAAATGTTPVAIKAAGNRAAGKGEVRLTALESIKGTATSSRIEAPSVNLNSVSGTIEGSAGGALHVNTGFNPNPNSREFGDPALPGSTIDPNPLLGLSASAQGDINIKSDIWSGNSKGTILVDKVQSLGGNVTLTAKGQILDNNPVETIDQRTYAQLLTFWNQLGLVSGAENTKKTDDAIVSLERGRRQSYNQYWEIRKTQADGGAAYDASFVVKVVAGSKQETALKDHFTNKAGLEGITGQAAVDTYIAQQITDYETRKTEEYRDLHASLDVGTAAFDPAYSGALSQAEKDNLRETSKWTERELAFSLSPGALKTVTGTNPVLKDANVIGRKVTLNAGFGVGETVNSDQSQPNGGLSGAGVQFRSDTLPSALTLEQKVALAAAERSDLILTVGPVGALPANATQAQIDARNEALALGLGAAGSSTVIELGKEFDQLNNVQQKALNAAAAGLIGASDTLLTILSKRPVNFEASEALDVSVTSAAGSLDQGAAYVASRKDARLGNLTVDGETRVKVRGDITNAATSNINTGNLVLEAAQGRIGSAGNLLNLAQKAGATTTARAQNGVHLNFTQDGRIDTVYSPNSDDNPLTADITLKAAGSLFNANNDDLINVLGTDIVLEAGTGSIGTAGRALNVGVNIGGGITAKTNGGGLNLFGPATNKFIIRQATSNSGAIKLTGGGESIVDGVVSTAGGISLAAGTRQVLTDKAVVLAVADNVSVEAGSLKIVNGGTVSATTGRVIVNTVGDALVTGITSGSSDMAAIDVTAGGRVFGGTVAGRIDLTAMAAGAGVKVKGGTGLGDKIQANDGFVTTEENEVTDIANPITIKTNKVDLEATSGNLEASVVGDITGGSLTASNGEINFAGDSNVTLDTATSSGGQTITANGDLSTGTLTTTDAGADVTISSTTGSLNATAINSGGSVTGSAATTLSAGNVTSNGSQSFTGGGDVNVGMLTANGSGSNVEVTSTGAAVNMGNVNAGGSVTGNASTSVDAGNVTSGGSQSFTGGTSVDVGTLVANGAGSNVSITAGTSANVADATAGGSINVGATTGPLNVQNLNAGTSVGLNSGGSLNVGTSTSGGSQTMVSVDDATFTQITTTGIPSDIGDVAVTSTNGQILGGDIDANGSITLNGNGVTFGNTNAGVNSTVTSTGDITGNSQTAGQSIVNVAGAGGGQGDMNIGTLRAADMSLSATGSLNLGNVEVSDQLTLRASDVTANITQVPASNQSLSLTMTGPNGTIGRLLNVFVDANGVVVPDLAFVDANFNTTASLTDILQARIPGQLTLIRPDQKIIADNRSPFPRHDANVQLFDPTAVFKLRLSKTASLTSAFVVDYDTTAKSSDELRNEVFRGISLLRDSKRFMLETDDRKIEGDLRDSNSDENDPLDVVDFSNTTVEIDGVEYVIRLSRNGPLVQLGGSN